jgi:hypothetical protein
MLKWIANKYGVRIWTGLNWIRIGSAGGFL